MYLPEPRGPLSSLVFAALREDDAATGRIALPQRHLSTSGPLNDDDRQITLWSLYELSYAGFEDVDDTWEWSCAALAVRHVLETELENWLRNATATSVRSVLEGSGGLADRLFKLATPTPGRSLSRFVRNHASRDQAAELLIHRSIYNLKEADPHTWVIPRLSGVAKVALVELQYDEYGAGRSDRQHARMFADTMQAAGLDSTYGAYIDNVPAATLALSNLVSMLGLHRRLRGAAMGHLAAFEATSSLPSRDVAAGLVRLGLSSAAAYFDEHVEADAVHEQLAARSICEVLASSDPAIANDIAFGASACLLVDHHAARYLLDQWQRGESSLRGRQMTAARLVSQP
jgi:hypothetical protein